MLRQLPPGSVISAAPVCGPVALLTAPGAPRDLFAVASGRTVVSPGIYPLTGPTTLLQAVALAKGPDPREANLRKVAIFRNEEGGRRATLHDLSAIRAGKQVDPLVQPDDVIVVETSRGRSLLRDITGALPLFSILF